MYFTQKVKAVTITSLLSMVTGILVMSGWISGVLPFESEKLNYILIMFNSGLGFVLLGGALFITQFPLKKYNTIAFLVLALLIFLIGSITLSQYLFYFNPGFDQFFITDGLAIARKYAFPGRMSATTSICFVLFALSLFGFTFKRTFIHILSQYLLHLITAIAALAVINYLYGLSLFFDLYYVNSISVPAAILFLLLSATASLLHPSLGITKLFTGRQVGNIVVRRILLLVILRIVIFGIFREQSRRYHLFSLEIDVSLLAVCFFAVGLGILWNTATWLNRIDKKRHEAEEEIKVMNETLEKRVWDRTAELLDSLELLKKSESNYYSLIEQASDAIYVLGFDGAFKDINAAMCTATGFTRDELLQMNLADIVDPEQLKTDPILKSRLTRERSIIRERRFMCKTGEMFEVEINAKIIADDRILAIARDITARRAAEDVLKRSEANLKIIMDTTDSAYVLMDKELNVMTFNQMAGKFLTEHFKYTPTKGDRLPDYIPKEILPQFMMYAKAVLKGNNISYEINFPQPDGSHCWFYTRLFPITNDKNEILGLMLALSDISERKNAEESLKTAYAQIKTHVNSLNEIAWKQSHLVRIPVSNLLSLVEMLQNNPSDEKILSYMKLVLERLDKVAVEMADEASEHLQQTFQQL